MASTRGYPGDQTTAWHVVIGSARGAAHRASGMSNQDSVAHQATGGPGGAVVAAVADGHGHARHFRSAVGSALAVDVACRSATRLADGLTAYTLENDVTAAVRRDLVHAIVQDWRDAVGERLEAEPYTASEQSALDLAGDDPEIPYGTTLLLAMVTARWLVCAQIGDGDLLAILPDGRSFYPLPGDSRLDGQRTTSLCQPDAVASFRTSVCDLDQTPLLAVLLATDGYSNAQAAEAWQSGVGQDLARFAAEHDPHWFGRQVPSWAERCASTDGSGDDTTIALLLRPAAAVPTQPAPPTLPEPPTLPAPPTPAGTGPGGSHRRRAGIAAAAIAAAVLAVVVIVLFIQRPAARTDNNPARTGRPVTAQSTSVANPRAPFPPAGASGPGRALPRAKPISGTARKKGR
jgi:Protein phosphatase 2C